MYGYIIIMTNMEITPKEQELLLFVHRKDATYAGEVVRLLGWFQPQATAYLQRLVIKGLIKRLPLNPSPEEIGWVVNCKKRNEHNLKRFRGVTVDVLSIFLKNPQHPDYSAEIQKAAKEEYEKLVKPHQQGLEQVKPIL